MKVAVSALGGTRDSLVDQRFGRARWFVVVDTQTGECTCLDNGEGAGLSGGAGIQAAQAVAQSGAKAVITGHCGPKAFRALTAAGIKVYYAAGGTVSEVVEKFKRGELKEAGAANVEGHWS